MPDFSDIAAPLHRLLKKEVKWTWAEAEKKAMKKLKDKLTCVPVLTYPRFELPFMIQSNASHLGLGAVLTQEIDEVIAYAIRG